MISYAGIAALNLKSANMKCNEQHGMHTVTVLVQTAQHYNRALGTLSCSIMSTATKINYTLI